MALCLCLLVEASFGSMWLVGYGRASIDSIKSNVNSAIVATLHFLSSLNAYSSGRNMSSNSVTRFDIKRVNNIPVSTLQRRSFHDRLRHLKVWCFRCTNFGNVAVNGV
jgi:hypothetical protein